ncbi:MAG: hypothetical protein K0S61_1029 [Anaerocolumna sp.]|jgi:hypothetical protein|nr:hypothetical protein [Anaerocolumna sp.]
MFVTFSHDLTNTSAILILMKKFIYHIIGSSGYSLCKNARIILVNYGKMIVVSKNNTFFYSLYLGSIAGQICMGIV